MADWETVFNEDRFNWDDKIKNVTTAYEGGFEDGVQYVLELMDTYINRFALDGELYTQARACEEMLEDIKETIDNT